MAAAAISLLIHVVEKSFVFLTIFSERYTGIMNHVLTSFPATLFAIQKLIKYDNIFLFGF